MIFETLIAAGVVMLASLSGILFIQKTAKSFLETKLSYLISFSAGVFLITAGGLGLEVFELAPSVWIGALLIGSGYMLAWGIHALLPETHHHHDPLCEHKHGMAAKKLIIGDSIHNIADGIILVVAFSASPALGIAATVSIFIHEALQEVSEFFVLRQAGYSVKKALAINLAVSSTILIGVFLGYFALATHELEVLLLAVSAGFFLHVVIHDLLPKRSHHEDPITFLKHVLIVMIGAILMGSIAGYLSDSHSHGEGEHEEEHESAEHVGE
jgi:zinc and cadmium transporter